MFLASLYHATVYRPKPWLRGTTRVACYLWALPTTLVGIVVALLTLLTGGKLRGHSGVLEIEGGAATWLLRRVGAGAMTLGHVVLALDRRAHERSRRHERVHVRQVERWGPLFLPAYALASVVARWRGRHYYYGNRFEIEAYGEDLSGYVGRGT